MSTHEPIETGISAPSFALSDAGGTSLQVPTGEPTVLVFYRGFW